jgi:hypothetical protein
MSVTNKRKSQISESGDEDRLIRRKKLKPGHFCLLDDGLDINQDESDEDYVGTGKSL